MKTIASPAPRSFRWTVEKYDKLVAKGTFANQRVELLEGRIIQLPPKLETHVAGVSLTARALERAFGAGYYVRRESPLRQGTRSKPEPDIAVVRGSERDFVKRGPPEVALLVVEVSEYTLRYDRGRKAGVYARHGITDFWIVNLVERQLEVHRDPIADAAAKRGFRYNSIRFFKPGESIAPLAAPQASVTVAELLP